MKNASKLDEAISLCRVELLTGTESQQHLYDMGKADGIYPEMIRRALEFLGAESFRAINQETGHARIYWRLP